MSWMRTDWDFGDRYAIFTVGERELYLWATVHGFLAKSDGDPEQLAAALEEMVVAERPNLKGCVVASIRLGICLFWEVCVVHLSLPRVRMGHQPDSVRLKTCPICHGDFVLGKQTSRMSIPSKEEPYFQTVELCHACTQRCCVAGCNLVQDFSEAYPTDNPGPPDTSKCKPLATATFDEKINVKNGETLVAEFGPIQMGLDSDDTGANSQDLDFRELDRAVMKAAKVRPGTIPSFSEEAKAALDSNNQDAVKLEEKWTFAGNSTSIQDQARINRHSSAFIRDQARINETLKRRD